MSAFVHATTKPLQPRTASAAAWPPGRWYAMAVVLHLVAAVALVWLTPLRSVLLDAPPSRTDTVDHMTPHEFREVSRTVGDAAMAKLTRQVDRLSSIERDLESIERDRLDAARRDLPNSEPDPTAARAALEHAEALMRKSLAAMESAPDDEATMEPVEATLFELDDLLAAAADHVPMFDETWQPVLEAIVATHDLQDQARDAWARAMANGADGTDDAVSQASRKQEEYRKKRDEADRKDEQVAERREKLRDEQDKLAELQAQRQEAHDDRSRARLDDKIRQQEHRIADRTRQVDQYAAKAVEYRQSLGELEMTARAADEMVAAARAASAASRRDAAARQREASAARRRAADLFDRVMSGAPSRDSLEATPTAPAEAYALARERERAITARYKSWRAAELARLTGMSYGQALRQADVVQPVRPDFDAAPSDTAASWKHDRERLEAMLRETASMVSLAESLLGSARRQDEARGTGYPLTADVERQQARDRMRLASVDASGRIVDLTQHGDGPGAAPPPQEVSVARVDAFARKITANGTPSRWMSIDSWYVIGPFDNAGRRNIDRQFPPESVIDLDAVYVGKGGRMVRWQYRPTGKTEVVPRNEEPYGIWYATTELWSDCEREVWLAMGSDDQGRLWVNGDLVWVSASRHKDWTVGEALRRVRLLSGRNRILYRIENGHGGMAYSLCVALDALP